MKKTDVKEDKALEEVMAEIEKQFGKGAIMKLGSEDHMEIEIGESETAEIFIVKFNGEELYEEIQTDANEINKRMGSFYG